MIDLSTISEEVRLARGDYSTVRSAHEDEKKALAKLSDEMTTVTSRVLRAAQQDEPARPENIAVLLTSAQSILLSMNECVARIESLAAQRAELKKAAWGK